MLNASLLLEKEPGNDSTKLIVRLKGKLCLETVHNFIETMRAEEASALILDMSEVTFLDSAGVGSLVSLFVSRKHHGRTLALAALSQQGNAVLQVAGLNKLLSIYPSVGEALGNKV